MSPKLLAPLGLAFSALLVTAAPSFSQESGGCGGLFGFLCPSAPPPPPPPVAEAQPEPPAPAPKPKKVKKPKKAAAKQQPAATPQ
jgi:outer membrane biosynthesis protein TonB